MGPVAVHPENIGLVSHHQVFELWKHPLLYVFIHILLNAIQVLEESGDELQKTINISAGESRKESRKVSCISISNNGPPIPEHELSKIYDPFYTIDKEGKGKGLGMAISYMIMKEHQGWIEARNKDDRVIFDVILPRN